MSTNLCTDGITCLKRARKKGHRKRQLTENDTPFLQKSERFDNTLIFILFCANFGTVCTVVAHAALHLEFGLCKG